MLVARAHDYASGRRHGDSPFFLNLAHHPTTKQSTQHRHAHSRRAHTQADEDALISAARSGNDAEVTRLLGKGVNVNYKNSVSASF